MVSPLGTVILVWGICFIFGYLDVSYELLWPAEAPDALEWLLGASANLPRSAGDSRCGVPPEESGGRPAFHGAYLKD